MKNKSIGRYILLAAGVLCLIYGAVLLNYVHFSGMVLIWFVMGAGFAGLSVRCVYRFIFSAKWVRVLALTAAALVIALEGVIVASGSGPLPRASFDYIIVLGGSIVGEVPTQTLQYRMDKAYQYLAAHPETKAVLTGGQGRGEAISEAEAMARFLAAKGIDQARLVKEDQAKDTYENMKFSFALVGDDHNLKLCVVSSDFHILRAKMLSLKMGRQVSGMGAPTYLPLIPFFHLREMMAVVKDLVIR